MSEAFQRVTELEALVKTLQKDDPEIKHRLQGVDGLLPKTDPRPLPSASILQNEEGSIHSTQSTHSFEDDLQSSKVYNKSSTTSSGPASVFSSVVTLTTKTPYSGLSLADTNVANLIIPIYAEDIHNSELYNFKTRDVRSETDQNSSGDETTEGHETSPMKRQRRRHTTSLDEVKNIQNGALHHHSEKIDPKSLAQSIVIEAILNHDKSLPSQDIEGCRRLDLSDQERKEATWISCSSHMQRSLEITNESRTFLINGCNFEKANNFTSPLSFLCAELSYFNMSAELTVVISYFCGLNTSRNSGANARGMMHSSIGQLLSQGMFDLSDVDDDIFRKVKKDVKANCDLFCRLALQLPLASRLFCIIDTISIYESSTRRDETVLAMRKLVKMVGKLKDKVCLRLLVTAPGRSLEVTHEIDFDEILDVSVE